jgi:hypothetical protein
MTDVEIPFEELGQADISPGALLRTGFSGQLAGEPINRAFGAGNMGGFRILGGADNGYKLAVLFTTFEDPDWPDSLDRNDRRFVYYGDNKDPGRALLDTPKHGNSLLQYVFEIIHARSDERHEVPPFFVASKAGHSRDVVYQGLAAPGGPEVSETEDLIAIWKTRGGERFQNYKAVFTILDAPVVSANWIRDLREGRGSMTANAPTAWRRWVETGSYR